MLFWVTAAALGLAAVVAASAPAFAAIKLAGASYALLAARGRIVLIGLGARLALERRS